MGIKRLIVGIHDRSENKLSALNEKHMQAFSGFVKRIESVPVEKLPKMYRSWDSSLLLLFIYLFLEKIKQELAKLPEGTVLVSELLPGSLEFKFEVIRSPKTTAEEYNFLIESFISHAWL